MEARELEFERLKTLRIGIQEWKVLLALAYDGPQNMYRISRKYNSQYPVVHRATIGLEKMRWIRVVKRRRSEKNRIARTYGLTAEGLLWIFTRIPTPIPERLPNLLERGQLKKTEEARASPTSIPPERLRNLLEKGQLEEHEEARAKLSNLENQEDVQLHMLYEFSLYGVDRIAVSNTGLFPLVFRKWKSYKNTVVANFLGMILSRAAHSTLAEYYYGSTPRAHTLERVFTYKTYGALLDSIGTIYANSEPKDKKRLLNGVLMIYNENLELRPLLDQIRSELETSLKENLSFLNRIKVEAGAH